MSDLIKKWRKLSENKKMIHNIPQVMQMITMLEEQDERIAELEELVDMLIDCQSADASLIPIMYNAWLHKAKWLKGGAE